MTDGQVPSPAADLARVLTPANVAIVGAKD
jgi:hypothetical protein